MNQRKKNVAFEDEHKLETSDLGIINDEDNEDNQMDNDYVEFN